MGQQRYQGKNQDTLKDMKIRKQNPKSVEHKESKPKREIHTFTGLSPKNK